MHTPSISFAIGAVWLGVCLHAPMARAQASSEPDATEASGEQGDDAAAREAFEAGRDAYDAGQFEVALERFHEAYRWADGDARAVLLFNIAQALDRLDRRPEAIEYYERYLRLLPEGPHAGVAHGRLRVLRRDQVASTAPLRQPPPTPFFHR